MKGCMGWGWLGILLVLAGGCGGAGDGAREEDGSREYRGHQSELYGGLRDDAGLGIYTRVSADGQEVHLYLCTDAVSRKIAEWRQCDQSGVSFSEDMTGLAHLGWKRVLPGVFQLPLMSDKSRRFMQIVLDSLVAEQHVAQMLSRYAYEEDEDAEYFRPTDDLLKKAQEVSEVHAEMLFPSAATEKTTREVAGVGALIVGSQQSMKYALDHSDVYQVAKHPMMLPKRLHFFTQQSWHFKLRNSVYDIAHHRPMRAVGVLMLVGASLAYIHRLATGQRLASRLEIVTGEEQVALWPLLTTLLLQSDDYVFKVPDVLPWVLRLSDAMMMQELSELTP